MDKCEFCGATTQLERHHVFNGAFRKKSEKFGAVATLCHCCHNEPPNGVHFNSEKMKMLKAKYQAQIMERFQMGTKDFISEFGKNYID